MKTARIKNGFTILEVLMSMVILAVLMTAIAVAFDASIINFQANDSISKTTNAARAALLRMTTELRTAQSVATLGTGAGFDPTNLSQCSLATPDGTICYWFDQNNGVLRLDADGNVATHSTSDPALCKNVTAVTFARATVPGDTSKIRNVRIVLTLTDDKGKNPQTMAAAAVVRRNLD
jgi:prepilin-type N-terminal cleavage/methylation domain-containing protein